MKELTVDDASKQLSHLIAEAADGEIVYIVENGHRVLLMPVPKRGSFLDLGKNPIEDDLTDAARNHDLYIYGRH